MKQGKTREGGESCNAFALATRTNGDLYVQFAKQLHARNRAGRCDSGIKIKPFEAHGYEVLSISVCVTMYTSVLMSSVSLLHPELGA